MRTLLYIMLIVISSTATTLSVGDAAPDFVVSSGCSDTIHSNSISNKIKVIFYEHKNASSVNNDAKDVLNAFFDSQPIQLQAMITRIPIIDATQAFNLIRPLWMAKFRKISEETELIIYGDWGGEMIQDYGFQEETTNLLIIDQEGIIRHISEGVTSPEELEEIKEMLNELMM